MHYSPMHDFPMTPLACLLLHDPPKVSIGSDAVLIAEEYIKTGVKTKTSSIETISEVYGAQAVVISVDPRRVYVSSPEATARHTIKTVRWPWPAAPSKKSKSKKSKIIFFPKNRDFGPSARSMPPTPPPIPPSIPPSITPSIPHAHCAGASLPHAPAPCCRE